MKKIEIALFCIFLTYIAIFLTGVFKPEFFDAALRTPIQAAHILAFKTVVRDVAHPPVYWNPERDPRKGVIAYDPIRAHNGLTLFARGQQRDIGLIDMQGHRVHTWKMPPNDENMQTGRAILVPPPALAGDCDALRSNVLWLPGNLGLGSSVPERQNISALHLYPDGSLLILSMGLTEGAKGEGLLKLDKDSHVLWKYDDIVTHHDVTVGPDGRIYVLGQKIGNVSVSDQTTAQNPCHIEDFLLVLSPEGNELRRISLRGAIERMIEKGGHPGDFLRDSMARQEDVLHTNAVIVIPEGLEDKAPMLKAGNILLSFRTISLLAILDPRTQEITWASYGPWHDQHSPRLLKDGSVILFDNTGNIFEGATSRVLRVDLNTMSILWQYDGEGGKMLASDSQGTVNPLPNGNILVTESLASRVFEVTPTGEVVWDYLTEDRFEGVDGQKLAVALFAAQRYLPGDIPFLNQGKTP